MFHSPQLKRKRARLASYPSGEFPTSLQPTAARRYAHSIFRAVGIASTILRMFTQESLTQALAPRAVRYLPRTGSSNDDALAWLADGAPDGAVVITDEQTRGRGRLGRTWHAPPGSALLLSIVLRPHPAHLPQLTMLGALAVCELVESYGVGSADIKWPNDVRVNGRKISGVLPEAAWNGDRLSGAVLGIGFNLKVDFNGTPFEDTATSLSRQMTSEVSALDTLTRLLECVDRWRARLGQAALYQAWRVRLALGGRVQVAGHDGALQGVAEDVTAEGALLLRLESGALRRVLAGDVFEV